MDLHAPQSGVIPCSSTHFKGGPAADLDKSCPSGSMFTGSISDGPTGNPDRSSTKGTNNPTSFTTVIGRQSFRLLATQTLLIISTPTQILAATILPIELNCGCKNEAGTKRGKFGLLLRSESGISANTLDPNKANESVFTRSPKAISRGLRLES